MIGNEERNFINLIDEMGRYILNGSMHGDKEGEFTYIGLRGNRVIDYVIVNEIGMELVKKFVVEDRVDSDHMQLVVTIEVRDKKTKTGRDDEEQRFAGIKRTKRI
ncbi:hypothetical protein X777_10436 [Ooceraea biroi]|uniref:Endonuclease/exonuclease/phosphatase domain-containing protein n=1 Tax=Ooceraea biroi TaxID=2015173 RepID=A0A026W804_OOCBI|nr:hypothetical protein X777_10436 [Ooceraea biroi]